MFVGSRLQQSLLGSSSVDMQSTGNARSSQDLWEPPRSVDESSSLDSLPELDWEEHKILEEESESAVRPKPADSDELWHAEGADPEHDETHMVAARPVGPRPESAASCPRHAFRMRRGLREQREQPHQPAPPLELLALAGPAGRALRARGHLRT